MNYLHKAGEIYIEYLNNNELEELLYIISMHIPSALVKADNILKEIKFRQEIGSPDEKSSYKYSEEYNLGKLYEEFDVSVSPDQFLEIASILRTTGKNLPAVKKYREYTGTSLKAAVHFITELKNRLLERGLM